MSGFYLNLTSKSKIYSTTNTASSFRVLLPSEIDLKGKWECALIELFLPGQTTLKPKYITTNFLDLSVVGEHVQRLLRVFYEKKRHLTFSPEYYPVSSDRLYELTFDIFDETDALKISGETQLKLHFMPVV